jgi:hypothetical protein
MGYESAVILVTVLSTISVCAVVLSIINIFGKLEGKVDVINLMKIQRRIEEKIEDNYRLIDRSVEDIHNTYDNKYEKLYDYISKVDKRIDSRSDKLVDHMCREMNVLHDKIDKKEEKKLLND